ncbi:MAG: peptide ABC transporter substrate-binding protein [Proteobacteria bacterium]|nr:peptide ABC transporter substrate-binding protein [Pseudomonadota bacterium]
MLCTGLPTIENGRAKIVDLPSGGKGIAATYTLRSDVRWGDGAPVTTKDVLFSWRLGNQNDFGFNNPELYRNIVRIDAADERSFTLTTGHLQYDYNDVHDLQVLPEHIEGPVVAGLSNPADYNKLSTFNREPTNPALYNGPYLITEFKSGSHVVLTPNPRWAGDKPFFAKVTVRVIENTAALEQNLLSGDVDYIAGEGFGLPVDQGLSVRKRFPDRFDYQFVPAQSFEHLDFQLDNPLFADRRVRQALLYAMNRQALSDRLFEGKSPVTKTWVSLRDFGYAPEIKEYLYDQARARALLEEAGFKAGPDGIRVSPSGQRLSFEFRTTAGLQVRELVQQILQSQWKEIGAEATIKNEPARTFFGETLRKRSFTGIALYAQASKPEQSPVIFLGSANIPRPENNFGGSNFPGYANPTMDKLIAAVEVELDPAKRKLLWRDMQGLYAEDLPQIPLYFNANAFLVPKWLKGIVPTGHAYPTSYWIERWRAE